MKVRGFVNHILDDLVQRWSLMIMFNDFLLRSVALNE